MAIVHPYGDPNAHGSLNKSLTFRRYKNKVVLQVTPRPRITHTPEQLAQRAKVTAGNQAYSMLTNATKWFYHKRATQQETTRKGLFMRAHMRGRLPSTNQPIYCKAIDDMVIFNPAGYYPDNMTISIHNIYPLGINPLWDLCDLWNKSGSNAEIETSEKGPDGMVHGTLEYRAAKFDNGMYIDHIDNYATYDLRTDTTAGAAEIWFTAEIDSVDMPANATLLNINSVTAGDPVYDFIYLSYAGTFQTWFFQFGKAGSYVAIHTSAIPFTEGEKIHVLLVWDKNGIAGGNKKIELFINGDSRSSTTIDKIPDWGSYEPLLYVGIYFWATKHYPTLNTLDNLKIYHAPAMTQEIIDLIIATKDTEGFYDEKIYAMVLDNSNLFSKLQEVPLYGTQIIRLSTSGGNRIIIPFRYLISVEWRDHNDVVTNSTIRLPQLTIEALQTVELYLSRDWSVYWDKNLRRLACASRL